MNAVSYKEKDMSSFFDASKIYAFAFHRNKEVSKVYHFVYDDAFDDLSTNATSIRYILSKNVVNRESNIPTSIVPKTELVRKLLAIRKKYMENGGKLLSLEEIAEEIQNRRGGLNNGQASIP
jgi:hypothetical protein